MEEKSHIKFDSFSDHLAGAFKNFVEEGHFSDVTLVSDDQKQFKAHKVVLSACSPVLKTLLINNPHSHPLLYLRGIKQTELQAILKFMYFGETQIFENRINDFVSVAKDLELKEISEEQEEDAENETNGSNQEDETEETFENENQTGEELIMKTETINQTRAVSKPRANRQSGVVSKSGKTYNCQECEATFGSDRGLLYHRKNKHEGVKYPCTKCDYQATTQGNLKDHIRYKHEGIGYPCSQCDYKATQQLPNSLQFYLISK